MFLELTLIDALIIIFILFKALKPAKVSLGSSIHGLIAVSLIIALILGLRLNAEMRDLLSGIANYMDVIPGLGSKLLIILASWYLMRLIRDRLGTWIEAAVPEQNLAPVTRYTEVIRSVLLISLILWIIEGFFDDNVPLSVQGVRYIDSLIFSAGQS